MKLAPVALCIRKVSHEKASDEIIWQYRRPAGGKRAGLACASSLEFVWLGGFAEERNGRLKYGDQALAHGQPSLVALARHC